ncbi:MAG: hypothetical protein DRP94_01235 [Candidatus Latescibacterota bacterium]|nr:MAG: hypothetical protein DRP94_01235 [Candidatus Latescibacterota bacterium]RKY74485.1 MAG: hypothetical protein DRQ14_01830 [Candidatus Latescibacterota bacterium]HDH99704.1 roadblock/LC7 domain-containing protein [Bacillota bacterium]
METRAYPGKFVLNDELVEAINRTLLTLLEKTDARCVLLAGADGYPIAVQGLTCNMDIRSFSALAAGAFSSTKELAKLAGEQGFCSQFHQGDKHHLYMSSVGDKAILVVVFDNRTTIGMVRMFTLRTASQLEEVLEKTPGPSEEALGEPQLENLSESLRAKIDKIFDEK